MTNNPETNYNNRNVISERIERLTDRTTSDRTGRTNRTTSGQTDRTIILPEYHRNGRPLNGSSQQDRYYNEPEDDEFTVPILPMCFAIVCGVMNFIIPGFGTILAGIFSPCCARSEFGVKEYSCISACVIIGVGFLQLLLTACFLIGWVWSAIWGIALIGTASDFSNYDASIAEDGSYWRNRPISNRSRRSVRPRSNFIYPMRAPSNVDYVSPPPPYQMFGSPPPRYASRPSSERYRSTTASPIGRSELISSGRTMTTTQIIEDSGEAVSWDCPQCFKVYDSETQKFLCRRCSRDVCPRCYTKQVRTRDNERVTVCDRCFIQVSEDQRQPRD